VTFSLANLHFQIIKVCGRIGFRPKPYSPLAEGIITEIENFGFVKEYLHLTSRHRHTQLMPLTDINDVIEVSEKMAHSFDDSIDPDILLQGIRPSKVIVSVVCRTPDQATSHISLAIHG
jgi:cobyrinic acid a,c-diamide synthase